MHAWMIAAAILLAPSRGAAQPARSIATGDDFTCVVMSDASARCWGSGEHGQIGDGSTEDAWAPTAVRGLSEVAQLDAGDAHACAVRQDGTVWCWGSNTHGELGDGTETMRSAPVEVRGLGSAVAVAAGATHTCALLRDATVWCWGENAHGELGSGAPWGLSATRTLESSEGPMRETERSAIPVLVSEVRGARGIAVGRGASCALLRGGAVRCWGLLTQGGAARTIQGPTPVALARAARATEVVLHERSLCTVLAGRVSCQTAISAIPLALTPIAGLARVTQLAGSADHGCAVIDDGTVQCWGVPFSGAHSIDDPAPPSVPPSALAGVRDVAQVAMGSRHACALDRNGNVWCWGHGGRGQLADGSRPRRTTPMPVPGLAGVAQLALGGRHSCALHDDGTVRCWGSNWYHAIDDGRSEDRVVPTAVPGIAGATQIAIGSNHGCARLADGTARCWGWNRDGQLGDGTRIDRGLARPVLGLTNVLELACGSGHSCALRTDGTVMCWGRNDRAQLGDGTHRDRLAPTLVANVSDATRIAVRRFRTCAMRRGGENLCWGDESGRAIAALEATGAGALGSQHECVIVDGAVRCRGANDQGQLGDGTTIARRAFTPVPGLSDVVEIAAGAYHTCARTRDGVVLCWGANDYAQLGDGSAMFRAAPTPVVF